jgi:hypothetical protein
LLEDDCTVFYPHLEKKLGLAIILDNIFKEEKYGKNRTRRNKQ